MNQKSVQNNDLIEKGFLSREVSYIVKLVASVFIMFSHLITNYNYCFKASMWVGVFFFYFGFGTFLKKSNKQYMKKYIQKKIKSLMIPFFCIEIIYTGIYRMCYVHSDNLYRLVAEILGIKLLDSTLWYFVEAFAICLIFYLLYKIKTNNSIVIWIFLYIFFVILSVLFDIGTWWYISTSCFILGILFADYKDEISIILKNKFYKILECLLFVIFFILEILFINNTINISINKNWCITFFNLVNAPLCVLFLYIVLEGVKIPSNKITKILAYVSKWIYLLHFLFIMCFSFVKSKLLFYCCVVFVTFLISFGLAIFENKKRMKEPKRH